MTVRQRILKLIYPLAMLKAKLFSKHALVLTNNKNVSPLISFYSLQATLNNTTILNFEILKNKKVLIVNTASNCGYTAQYNELEKLYQLYKNNLIILAFPANNFKEQEKENDKAIANFCKTNYPISFTLMQKSNVIKTETQNNVFNWLSHANKNGWCNQPPVWNFCKYLINEKGVLTHYFNTGISPLNKKIVTAIKQ
ncbi:MAG: glutathione peroxidase [Bacteroidetes bacterium]|nr:glutathione peroxidase [Bacteroidota bacterium]MBS1649052.1 glutathione peroxidase [Bacteroidota bacterium]